MVGIETTGTKKKGYVAYKWLKIVDFGTNDIFPGTKYTN
jgi:hypothetical protein